MFPKCRQSFLCRAQIFTTGWGFGIDLRFGMWYDNGVGSDFSGLFFVRSAVPGTRRSDRSGAYRKCGLWPKGTKSHGTAPRPSPTSPTFLTLTWNDPRHPSGVISVPWVQSLGNLAFCWIDRAFLGWLESLPQHSCSSAYCLRLAFM